MMNKTVTLGFIGLMIVGLVAGAAFAFPMGGHGSEMFDGDYAAYKEMAESRGRGYVMTEDEFNDRAERRALAEQHREEVEAAIEAGDYYAWAEAMVDAPRGSPFGHLITEDNFEVFVQMHEAREAGDFDTASELADELGIEMPGHRGQGNGQGRGQGRGMGEGFGGCMR